MQRVVWIGGGTGSGKTTLARALAARHGLRRLAIDDRWYAHDALLAEPKLTPDGQWLDQTPAQQAEAFLATSAARFALTLAELAELPDEPPVVVEGPQILPELLPRGAAAVFLTVGPERQAEILRARSMPATRDPERALRNRVEKDRIVAERIVAAARAHGFPVLPPGADVEQVVRVPDAAPDVDLAAVRRWENAAYAANVRAWLASSDAPVEPPPPLPFGCECGARGCGEVVALTLEQYDRGGADAHAGRGSRAMRAAPG